MFHFPSPSLNLTINHYFSFSWQFHTSWIEEELPFPVPAAHTNLYGRGLIGSLHPAQQWGFRDVTPVSLGTDLRNLCLPQMHSLPLAAPGFTAPDVLPGLVWAGTCFKACPEMWIQTQQFQASPCTPILKNLCVLQESGFPSALLELSGPPCDS